MKNGKRVKSFFSQLKKMQKSEESAALIPATFLVIAALDAIPHPGDIGYFYTEKWLLDNKSKIDSKRFWAYKALNYYGWDVAWYIALFGLTYYGGKNVNQKIKLGIGAVSVGLLAHFIFKQSQKRKATTRATASTTGRALPSALARIGQVAKSDTLLLDVRTPAEYASGHIPGAVLVPTPPPPLDAPAVSELRRKLEIVTKDVPKHTQVLVYCKKGIRAGKAVEILKSMGFDARNLGGVLTHPRLALAARERVCPYCSKRFKSDPSRPIVCSRCGCKMRA